MSKPMIHAKSSARKYGGNPEDYLDIHQFMDSSKASLADVRHRALLHSSFGCFIVEQIYGVERINSAGKTYSPRDVAEDHCIEDLGFIPSVERWLGNMKIQTWMGGPANKNEREKRKFISMNDPEEDTQNLSFEKYMKARKEGQMKFRVSPGVSVKEIDG